jgi:hypothetical protein
MANQPIINISPTGGRDADVRWQASVEISDLGLHAYGPTPIDALSFLATKLASVLQRDRETRRHEQEEARLREQR